MAAKGITAGSYRPKVKRKGKAKKSWGPKECRVKKYAGQGR